MVNYFAGRYVLVDPIAEGGMGSVWRAWDARRSRYVAAKMLRAADASSLIRFVREQGLRIEHPHVVAPSSWAADDDKVLLTMDLVRGGNLANLFGDYGTLPPEYVAVLIDQLLAALSAVHAHGVVHRDVKPANILLEPTGTDAPHVRLSDFGIAVVLGEPRLTQATGFLGTPGYTAPESTVGAEPHPTQDIYAAGVVGLKALFGITPPDLVNDPSLLTHPTPLLWALLAFTATDPQSRPASADAARALWAQACQAADVGKVDSHNPEAVEVFDHIDQLPSGFTENGPLVDLEKAETPTSGAADGISPQFEESTPATEPPSAGPNVSERHDDFMPPLMSSEPVGQRPPSGTLRPSAKEVATSQRSTALLIAVIMTAILGIILIAVSVAAL
ncbi:MAG: serine/threonine protein kinase [Corynebacteriales bacterium]|nr:serine/threonine protein kinase [Mycobacteriales bacterium]